MDAALNGYRRGALGNLDSFFGALDRDALERAAQALADSRHVLVDGTCSARSIVLYLHLLAERHLGTGWVAQPGGNGHGAAADQLTSADVLVAVAAAPYRGDAAALAMRVRRTRARVIRIADRPDSPLTEPGVAVLVFPVRGSGAFASRVGGIALAEMLVGLAAARRNVTGRPRD